jgi:hypothetical protein
VLQPRLRPHRAPEKRVRLYHAGPPGRRGPVWPRRGVQERPHQVLPFNSPHIRNNDDGSGSEQNRNRFAISGFRGS